MAQQKELSFTKKTINIPDNASLLAFKRLSAEHLSDNYSEINNDVSKLLKKNEEVIIAYLERFIYTSNLSDTTKEQLADIFQIIDDNIIKPN